MFGVLAVAAPGDRLPLRVVYDQRARRVYLRRSGAAGQHEVAISDLGAECGDALPPVALVSFDADGAPAATAVPAGGLALSGAKGSPWVSAAEQAPWTGAGAIADAVICLATAPEANPHGH